MPKTFNLISGKPNESRAFTRRTGAKYLHQDILFSTMQHLDWNNRDIGRSLTAREIESNSLWRGWKSPGKSRAGLNWRLPKEGLVRPRSNVIHNVIEGLAHGGLAQKMRKFLSCFGSPWNKFLPGAILEGVEKMFSKLSGGKVSKIWEMSEESFISKVHSGEAGMFHLDLEDDVSQMALIGAKNQQAELGILQPGFVTHTVPATADTHASRYIFYNTAIGTRGKDGLRTAGFAQMSLNEEGQWVRAGLVVSPDFRGKGINSLAHRLSRSMFEAGALMPESLSTAGAKAYYRQVKSIAEEVASSGTKQVTATEVNSAVALRNMRAADNTATVPGLAKMMNGPRGIRQGVAGGAG
jgi:GNAT superfamily N-acetyltransferase